MFYCQILLYLLSQLPNTSQNISSFQLQRNYKFKSYNQIIPIDKNMQVQRFGDTQTSTQMHYLNILDKCSQIMREDRIWLRSQIKSNSQDALALFKGLSKMPNMKQLQIRLRKYVNHTKQKEKQQQLTRFKQNMNSTLNVGLKQHFNCKQNERQSHQKYKTMQTNRYQSQSHSRSPLQQKNQNRQSKSLISKWNNYAHYNYSTKTHQRDPSLQNNRQGQINNKSQTKKQWINIYKPHTFNKMLNGQLNNKLLTATKNQSATHLKRDNKSVQLKNYMDFNEKYQTDNQPNYQKTFTSTLNPANFSMNRANSSSLKKFDFNPTKQSVNTKPKLTTAQVGKYKIAKQPQTKSVTKPKSYNQQNYLSKNQSVLQTSKLSKQNIDQILKYKLGYPYQFDGLNEQANITNDIDRKYDSGQFPPIQQQTQRDSEYITSQRNQRNDQNKMFSIKNSNDYNHNKNWQMETSSKHGNNKIGSNMNHMNGTSYFTNLQNTFQKDSFSNMLSKDSKQNSQKSSREAQQYQQEDSYQPINRNNTQLLHLMNSKQYLTFEKDEQKINRLFSHDNDQYEQSYRNSNQNIQITQPVAHRLSSISNSNMKKSLVNNFPIIQSRQKSQVNEHIQLDLHKSILNSIRKSQQDFPSYGIESQSFQRQIRLSAPKSSPYNQFYDKSYSNPQQDREYHLKSQIKQRQAANQTNSFPTKESPLNFNISPFSATVKLAPIQKTSQNDEDIFTPPDLLNECRMFLKKSKQLPEINCDYSAKPILLDQSTPERLLNISSLNKNNNQNFKTYKTYVPQKRLMIDDHAITVTQSITKDYYFSSQKNSQQKQNPSEKGSSDSKMQMESKRVNFEMIGSVKPMENEFKQFSQHKLKTEQNYSNQNSMKKYSNNKNQYVLNQSIQKQKQLIQSKKSYGRDNTNLSMKNQSREKYLINQSQQSAKSKKVQQGDVVSYDGIHTFSNQSMSKSKQNSNKKTNRSAFNQVQLFDCKEKQSSKKKPIANTMPIHILISLQDLVDQFLEASEGNLEVSTQWLFYTIQNHCYFEQQVSKSLKKILSVFIDTNQEQILLLDVFEYLFNIYNQQSSFQYKDGNAKDIYLLLDIQKKGKITIQDINSFSQSLQEAEIQNFEIIAQKLQQMFQLANLSQKNILSYLNLYIIKNQPVFEQVCQLLEDFQFQIQAE